MAKNALPVFTRDQHTGSLKALARGGSDDFELVSDTAGSPYFRVLVADPNEADRLATIWMLDQAWPAGRNMLVECAADGAEALEKIRRNQYALLVLDWNMPKTAGADVLRTIRAGGPRVPVVVLAGQRREAIAPHLESLAAAFMHKDELDPCILSNAIASSILLLDGAFGLARAGYDTTRLSR